MENLDIINVLNEEQINQLLQLYKQTWWAKERTRAEVDLMLKTSMSFAVIQKESKILVGFARVLTDDIRYAFIFDVVLDYSLRGKGIGKSLLKNIIKHPRFTKIKYFELTCTPEMKSFYEQFGFSEDYEHVIPMRFCKA